MKIIAVLIPLSLLFACKRETTQPVPAGDNGVGGRTPSTDVLVTSKEMIICDQKNARIAIIDVANGNKITWEWSPTAAYSTIRTTARSWFSNLSEAKPVYGGKYILTTASGGGVAIINIATREAVWFDYAGGNTHSAEILPDGNVVTASSTGGYLTIFNVDSHLDDGSLKSPKIVFPDVHNVVWDHKNKLLWAAGRNKLKAFSYNMNCKKPELTLKRTYTLPNNGYAHELYPVFGSTTQLWLSSSTQVYRFDTNNGAFTLVKTVTGVKSVSSGPGSFQTIVDITNGRGGAPWRTDRITELNNGHPVYLSTTVGMYKARWRLPSCFSYPANDSYHECH